MSSVRMVAKLQARLLRSPFHSALKTSRGPATLFQKRWPLLGHYQGVFCSTLIPSTDVSLQYRHGRPVLEVPLFSRSEKCLFFLRPMLMSVGDLINDLQREDPGVTTSVLAKDGQRIANNTLIDTLLDNDFQLNINNVVYNVHSPEKEYCSSEHVKELNDMKYMVHLLHMALHLPDHHLLTERQLLERLDGLKQELSPLEKMKAQIARKAEFQSSRAVWAGLALLSVQGGSLAFLTFLYSWDVMEPVTYFLTYSTSIGVFAYYVLTKQDYVYPEARDRQFLHYFYKGTKRHGFNVEKYNELKDELYLVEEDLRRLRNPTQLQMPIEQIQLNEYCSSEHVKELNDMKHMVHLLHTALHLPDHHLLMERQLLERLDSLKQEKMKAQIARKAEFQSSRAVWAGLALLSVQGGALARLTWWEYNWDVVEPFTFFLTYSTSIGVFAYYIFTKQHYVYPWIKDRQFLHYFCKGTKRHGFNVEKYNELKDEIYLVEEDLRRLRNPTQLQMPIDQIQPKPNMPNYGPQQQYTIMKTNPSTHIEYSHSQKDQSKK